MSDQTGFIVTCDVHNRLPSIWRQENGKTRPRNIIITQPHFHL